MNALNLDVIGKVVVLSREVLQPGVDPRFLCENGFGCFACTAGTKIFGRFISDGAEALVHGSWLERLHDDQSVRPPSVSVSAPSVAKELA